MNARLSTSRARSALLLLLLLPAAVVPFVPFVRRTEGVSPWHVVTEFLQRIWHGEGDIFVFVGAPFFLGPLIVLWQVCCLTSVPMPRLARTTSLVCAAASALMSTGMLIVDLVYFSPWLHEFLKVSLHASALVGSGMLVGWLKQHATAERTTVAALAAFYLVNASFCLPPFAKTVPSVGS